MEEVMTDIMFEVPSLPGVKEVIIDENVVKNKEKPKLIFEQAV